MADYCHNGLYHFNDLLWTSLEKVNEVGGMAWDDAQAIPFLIGCRTGLSSESSAADLDTFQGASKEGTVLWVIV